MRTTVEPTASPEPTPSPIPTITADLPLADIEYRLPLTILHTTPDSATLLFELSAGSDGTVLVQAEQGSALPIELALDPANPRWMHTLQGLSPDTRYRVVVALGAPGAPPAQPRFRSEAWGPLSFQTAAPGEPLRVGVISDASFGDRATYDLARQMAEADLDFVLHAGDVVDETEVGRNPFESFAEKFYAPLQPLLTRMPVYTIPGNHDYDADIRLGETPFYYHAFPPFPDPLFPGQEAVERRQYYAFSRGDLQFLMLDTQVLFGVAGREDQELWLSERLGDPAFRASIVAMHVAPYSSSTVHPTDSLPPRQQWVPMFEAARVPLVISGHFHGYERLMENAITYLVAGGGSATLYSIGDRLPQSQVAHRRTHFVLLEIGDQVVATTTYALGGEVLDRADIALPPAP
jgi:predicted phosphodiesterase